MYKIAIFGLCIITAISLTAAAFIVQVTNLQDQISNLSAPNLVTVGMQYSDNGHGVLHISGYVYNSGAETAYESTLQVNLLRDNTLINTTNLFFGGAYPGDVFGSKIDGKTAVYVSSDVNYTGSQPTNVTFTTQWIAQWQIPVP